MSIHLNKFSKSPTGLGMCFVDFWWLCKVTIETVVLGRSRQFSRVSNSLQSHELKHARLPCPSPAPGAYSNSCPLSRRCHPTISSSVVQSFPASGSFQMSQFFASGGQRIGVSASASVLLMNIQDLFPIDGLVGSPCNERDSQESSPTPQFKSINSSVLSFLYSPTLISKGWSSRPPSVPGSGPGCLPAQVDQARGAEEAGGETWDPEPTRENHHRSKLTPQGFNSDALGLKCTFKEQSIAIKCTYCSH